ncbi:hypothetical protein EWI31_15710 [Streptomyces tsukubensis]|uniref:Uncharacterized protein n=1 Tax=Streptomyces tsukubensis (strain DSM 42081 / NBRC 108919 / NRRL 18488 / 9993) TaxID=1114943 RepID=A0A7G3UGK3_STRT9|nr:hypothetical protein STSU_015945 [Streptomyces tsukubensis NRRL18488]TAI43256.1 hypothetical protein EWI31_15710 [Streptomyces tsukubensis]
MEIPAQSGAGRAFLDVSFAQYAQRAAPGSGSRIRQRLLVGLVPGRPPQQPPQYPQHPPQHPPQRPPQQQ